MDVVFSHVGIPSSNITPQNDKTILLRKLVASGFSGGGCLAEDTAFGGGTGESSIVAVAMPSKGGKPSQLYYASSTTRLARLESDEYPRIMAWWCSAGTS